MCFPIQLDGVAVRRGNPVCRTVRLVLGPPADNVVLGEVRHQLLECRVVTYTETQVAESRRRVCRQLERMTLVVTPRAQIDGIAAPCGLVQAHNRGKEGQAVIRPRREQFEVAHVSHVAEARKRNWEKGSTHGYITSAISRSSQPWLTTPRP